ncbi:Spy/CpxP family protein refolding chaperone [Leptospira sp. GIMC2001]|uniref:Spy/CpxP family protein refolding chaperone n=1 Tax=Leptospira sp. GIMC2001 TaxID=1513297 RepID=UPI0023490EFD|nr:Spy/CpxP family protein refolding chaperone [Leptospira sp. GIMC2001]WCL49676.1 Spy/CpxP family protein refolding chaperone [Leptospira sp. GIMC2001]
MNNSLKSILVTALLIGGVSLSADGGDHFEHMAKHLKLTKEQKAQVDKIQNDSKSKKEAYKTSIKKAKEELHALLAADELDKPKIRAKMEELSKAKIDMKMLWIDNRSEVNKILTAEQKAKHKEMMKKHHEKMKDKKDKWEKKRD